MYAIETKKRKFDRILETIKDHASPRPTTPLRKHTSTASLAENSSSKKRRLDQFSKASNTSSVTSLTTAATYLPASREAFLQRLETFGPITKWHVPSTEDINAATWAKRGWWCVDTDTVGCKACNEHLPVKLDEGDEATAPESTEHDDGGEDNEEDRHAAANLRHQLLVEKYGDMVVTAHAQSCPWRNRGCDDSIQHVGGLLNTKSALESLKARYDSLWKLVIPSVLIPSDDGSWPPQDMTHFKLDTAEAEQSDPNTLNLAIAGWQASATRDDVAECRACFRSLGLWLYRGDAPVMEKLDAVDSHLEYCPWRSPDAQSTKIDVQGKKELVPAWVLVGRVIKEAAQQAGPDPAADNLAEDVEQLGEKEREAKVKELLRRVRGLRKPFNVKSLLRKKPAAK